MKFDWLKENECIIDAMGIFESDKKVMAYTVTHAKRLMLQCIKYNKNIHIKTKHLGTTSNLELMDWIKITCHKEVTKLIVDWKI